jgi:glycosyltransferase involved in cell wall biosynthesis
LKSADAVIVNGASGQRYVQRFGVLSRRIFRIPQTTEIAPLLAIPLHRPKSIRRRLIYCGRLIELKGLLPFLRHLMHWSRCNPQREVEMTLVGEGPLRSEIERLQLPGNLKLELPGQVSYSKLSEIYSQGGILVFPTLADEWGLVVVEAMAAGLPVLGSVNSQAVEDLVKDGVNGWTFVPDIPSQVVSALDRALESSDSELEALGRQARSTVENLTPAKMSEGIILAAEYGFCHP